MAKPTAFKYRAFISYSHADTPSAKWLHRALEGFRIDKDLVGRETAVGPVPKKTCALCSATATAGSTLTEQALAALDASAALVVICSPAWAKSRYVAEEVRHFKAGHPDRPVVPLIVAGKPSDAELECFPPSLKFASPAESSMAIQWGDIDFDGGKIKIDKAVEATKAEGLRIEGPKLAYGRRLISLPSFALEALREHLSRSHRHFSCDNPGW